MNAQTLKPIPTIAEPPLVGSMFRHNNDRLALYLQVMKECGDVGRIRFGPFPMLLFSAPEFVHPILVEHANDFSKGVFMHKAFEPVIGNGLFINETPTHRIQRKLMAPSFQPRNIISYAGAMVRYSEQIQEGWHDGETLEIGEEMTALTMSVVGKVLFDADVFTETDELGAAMTTMLSFTNYVLSNLISFPLSWPLPRSNKARAALAVLDQRMQKMIDDRRHSSEEKNDFLSILLRARDEDGNTMSDKQIKDECLTLFGAGHETTATALTWTWYLLAQNPDVYTKLQTELDTVLQGRSPTYVDLPQLPYTLQVFKESMRLYPPAYAISRVALHDLEILGYPVKKDETIFLPIYAMHRRPEIYPDPEKFEPERFSPENEKQLPRHAYLPFGAGPRVCIGNHFAMMEGHLLLASIAQRVSFKLLPGQHIYPDPSQTITIRPSKDIKMSVHRR